ncbi:hypothetical protein [Caulobacter flavus]|nr:hypothetical protein [Caulobacter flavus]
MDWIDVAAEFEWDGSWRDIYVLDATLDDWRRTLDALRDLEPPPSFYEAGEPALLPLRPQAIFDRREETSFLLTLTVEGVRFNCHFFDDAEIEFDIDPREVQGQRELDVLRHFMELLARSTGKKAILTHENTKGAIIAAAAPPV